MTKRAQASKAAGPAATVLAPAASVRTAAPDFTFMGERQPAAFSRGVESAIEALRLMEVSGLGPADFEDLPSDVFTAIKNASTLGGKYAEGMIAGLCSYALVYQTSGQPNMEVWRPLGFPWCGDDCRDSAGRLPVFRTRRSPYFQSSRTRTCRNGRTDRHSTALTPGSLPSSANPISRAAFETLRWKLGSANREAKEKKREAA